MIWFEGKILPDDGLSISVLDRTFEHGLGLFETLRTWGGRATLLDRHKARMLRSAEELHLSIDPASLPDIEDVQNLLNAEGVEDDRMLRITASGGTDSTRSVVWMRSSPLPSPMSEGGAIVCVNAWSCPIYYSSPPLPGERRRTRGVPIPVCWDVDSRREPLTGEAPHSGPEGEEEREIGPIHPPDQFNSRHKTLNYWSRRFAFEQARELGYDEILFLDRSRGFTEGSRSNLFVVIGDKLITSSTETPIVPGIMRQLVLDVAEELLHETKEVWELSTDQFYSASEVFLTNAIRGIIPVARVETCYEKINLPSPGSWTQKLQELLARRLWPDRGEEAP